MLKIQVTKLDGLRAKLNSLYKQAQPGDVVVGFATDYALAVHEVTTNEHVVGQAKFLEQPARANKKRYKQISADRVADGGTLLQGLIDAAAELIRDAIPLVPVKTGTLRGSAFGPRVVR